MLTNPKKRIYLTIFISALPFLWLFTQMKTFGGGIQAFANITGFLGALLLLWQFILGIRFIASAIDVNYDSVNKVHKNLGKYGSIFVLLHPFMQLSSYGWSIFLSINLSSEFMRHVIFGRTAFYIYLIIFLTSVFFRKKLKYRPWLYIHYLSYPLMFFVFLHAGDIGTAINSFPTISIYWNVLTAIFFTLVIYRSISYLNIFKQKFILKSKKKISEDITVYSLTSKGKLNPPKPGQYYYIRNKFFGEAHPYSVLEIKNKKNILTFGIKNLGKHSGFLEKSKKGDTFYLDGPYGRFTQDGHNGDPKIIIAGGIGITPFVEFVKRYADNDTYMFYSNKKISEAVERKMLKKKLGKNYVDLVTGEKRYGKNIENSRLNNKIIKKYVPSRVLQSAKIYMCGSPGFMNACDFMLGELGVQPENIKKEEFSF